LSKSLIPNASDEESKGHFLKALADFQRYHAECAEIAEIPRIANESRQNYLKAIDLLKALPQPRMDLLFAAQLNIGILLGDYFDQKAKAIELLTQQHHELSVSLEKYPEDIRAKIREIGETMMSNIERWKPKGDEEEDS
jgi:hypothetical protein